MTNNIAHPPTGATSGTPGPEFRPIRGLADIVTVLLAVVVAFLWTRLAFQQLSPGSMHYFTDFELDRAADITIFGLSIRKYSGNPWEIVLRRPLDMTE